MSRSPGSRSSLGAPSRVSPMASLRLAPCYSDGFASDLHRIPFSPKRALTPRGICNFYSNLVRLYYTPPTCRRQLSFHTHRMRFHERSTPTDAKKNGLSQNSNRIERCTKTWQGMCAGGGLEPPARSITRPQAAQNAQLSNWSCAFCTGAGS